MRILLASLFLAFLSQAHAAPTGYELYILVCDASECHRATSVSLGADSPRSEYTGPGISLRMDTLSAVADAAEVRLNLDITPSLLAGAAPGAGRISVRVEPRTLRHVQYNAIATFSSANKVYQVWGRLAGPVPAAKSLALR